jgi:hypothetical protein
MEEAVRLILKMWAEPRTTFHGRYFHVEDAILEPKSMQKPRPPIMIAGGGERVTLRADWGCRAAGLARCPSFPWRSLVCAREGKRDQDQVIEIP